MKGLQASIKNLFLFKITQIKILAIIRDSFCHEKKTFDVLENRQTTSLIFVLHYFRILTHSGFFSIGHKNFSFQQMLILSSQVESSRKVDVFSYPNRIFSICRCFFMFPKRCSHSFCPNPDFTHYLVAGIAF